MSEISRRDIMKNKVVLITGGGTGIARMIMKYIFQVGEKKNQRKFAMTVII